MRSAVILSLAVVALCYGRMPSILGPVDPASISGCIKKGATVGNSPSAAEQARKNVRAQLEELLR